MGLENVGLSRRRLWSFCNFVRLPSQVSSIELLGHPIHCDAVHGSCGIEMSSCKQCEACQNVLDDDKLLRSLSWFGECGGIELVTAFL